MSEHTTGYESALRPRSYEVLERHFPNRHTIYLVSEPRGFQEPFLSRREALGAICAYFEEAGDDTT